jgi:hypothetical protein
MIEDMRGYGYEKTNFFDKFLLGMAVLLSLPVLTVKNAVIAPFKTLERIKQATNNLPKVVRFPTALALGVTAFVPAMVVGGAVGVYEWGKKFADGFKRRTTRDDDYKNSIR